jgi:hypothetical protein
MTKITTWLMRWSLPTPILARLENGPKAASRLCGSGYTDLVGYFSLSPSYHLFNKASVLHYAGSSRSARLCELLRETYEQIPREF